MIALLSLAGCGWNHLPQDGYSWLEDLWDPAGAVVARDGLYFRLGGGAMVRVANTEQDVTTVDVGDGAVTRIAATPDGSAVVALIERYGCVTDERLPRRPTADDCPPTDLRRSTELSVVRDAQAGPGTVLGASFNTVEVSADGAFAVAWLDLALLQDGVEDVVNLTGVAVLDVEGGESVLVSIGFAPERVLFAQDEGGATDRAVVLSRNQVVVIELGDGPPRRTVTFPLALDDDDEIDPLDVALTPDGQYALVTAQGRSDLYVLDLADPSINIVELVGDPARMVVVPDAGVAAVVFEDEPALQLVDLASFSWTVVGLDEPMDRILVEGDELLLHGLGDQHHVYRYETGTSDLVEYRVQNPVTAVSRSPDGAYSVALTRPEPSSGNGVDAVYDANPGMEILDLGTDESTPFLLEGQALGVAFDDEGRALLLQRNQTYLYRYDLVDRTEDTVRLTVPPRAVGALSDGTLWVTQDALFGQVTFLNPEPREVAGFALSGIAAPIRLVDEEAP